MNKKILIILLLFNFLHLVTRGAFADELSDIESRLLDLKRALTMSISATTPLEKNMDKLNSSLNVIRGKITGIEKDVAEKEKKIAEGEKMLISVEEVLSRKVREHYKNSAYFGNGLWYSLFKNDLDETMRQIGYQKKAVQSDRDTIVKVVLFVKDIEEKKRLLEEEKARLAAVKAETDKQAAILQKEISGAKNYQKELSSQIAKLSQRQQELIAQKLASLNLPSSLGAGPLYCTDDRKLDPGFRPAFAFFTFGIPHRVGLNQYGALGRAKAGQNYKDILNAYFSNFTFEKKDPNMKIKVQGHGEKALDEYLLGIYEMPGDWPLEALKAQVVAARSYALAYTGNGASEICTTQACQVYKGGNKGGNWEKAVRETAGEIMVSGGETVKAWFASTFGGYTFTSGDVWGSNRSWTKRMRDTEGEVGSFQDLFSKAYDRDSPCFYSAQGFRAEYSKSAWLKSDEVADIANVLMLAKKDSSVQSHLSQPDKPNPDGTDTWDKDRVKNELRSRGGSPYNSVSDITTDWNRGEGRTVTVTVNGDGGSNTFDGNEFRNFFNLRAPANIQIVGPLYNIERK